MAYTTHPATASFGATLTTFTATLARWGKALGSGILRAGEINSTAHRRLAQAERLQAKTDAELAELGIRREEIARYVFRDLFWN